MKKFQRVNGWDERDYKLWSSIQQLPSYGLIANNADNPMVSRQAVIKLLEKAAEERFQRTAPHIRKRDSKPLLPTARRRESSKRPPDGYAIVDASSDS